MRRILSPKRNKFQVAFSLLALLLLLQSCGNQESWVYKQWHNTLAHYNKFFNAEQKWLETYDITRENFKDDPRRPLTLFNYGDINSLKGNLASMDEVIKKASTMIDRHPRSRWVDDAYLLNGKAYFLKGEITAAENIFTYVIDHFKDPIPVYQAQLWIVRCLVIKKRVADADVLLATLMKKPEFPSELTHEAQFIQGAIQIELGKYAQAIKPLEASLPHLKQRIDKYRVHFALGECYLKEKEYAQAELHFSKIAKFNPPYEIAFRSKMAQVTILSEQQENYVKANTILGRMLKDEKNIDFLGTIYISMGNNELKAKRDPLAIKRYQQAAVVATDKVQRSNAYLALGDYFFNRKLYAISAKYFDSANAIIDEKHPNFASIAAKNDILSDLLKEVLTFTHQDSLLKMASDPNWRTAKIQEAIAREKLEAQVAAAKAAQMNKNNAATGFPGNPDFAPMNSGGGGMATAGQSSFPFYNPAQRIKGKQDFERLWGKRENADYWRYSNRKTNLEDGGGMVNKTGDNTSDGADDGSNKNGSGGINGAGGSKTATGNGSDGKGLDNKGKNANDGKLASADTSYIPKNIPAEEKKYYTGLPFSAAAKKTALEKIEKSEFAAAQIYQNRLNEPNSALELYISVIQRFPNSELSPQAHYEIIKIARTTGDYSLADQYKSKLINTFPKSIYVRMLESGQSMEAISTGNNKLIDSLVAKMGDAYRAEKFAEVAALKQIIDKDYAGNQQQAQIDFIYASSIIRSGDKTKGISLMEQVGNDYPTDPIGLRAKDVVEAYKKMEAALKPSTGTAANTTNTTGGSNGTATAGNTGTVSVSPFKKWDNKEELLVVFAVPKGTNVNLTRSILSDFNKKNFSFETNLEVTPGMPMGSQSIVIIRNFSKPVEAQKYAEIVKNSRDIFLARGIMEFQCKPISVSNYVILNKTLDVRGYLEFPGE